MAAASWDSRSLASAGYLVGGPTCTKATLHFVLCHQLWQPQADAQPMPDEGRAAGEDELPPMRPVPPVMTRRTGAPVWGWRVRAGSLMLWRTSKRWGVALALSGMVS